jgi:sigma-B regulation protein RsbU (phosphoserine phosphatase)
MEHLLQDMRTIGAMQKQLLPRNLPQPIGWEVAVHYQVGQWPSGDYYDFLPLADGRIVFLMADASDQGGPAAALIAMLRVSMHSCPLTSGQEQSPFCPLHGEVVQTPHIVLGNLNRIVFENTLDEQSMSAFCGILNPLEGDLHFANAGHPSPRWWHARSRTVEVLRYAVGLPLGLDYQATYHHKRIQMEPGDVLLFYTSGVSAARSRGREVFGLGRLDAALKQFAGAGAAAVKNGILARLEDALGKRPPEDDVTLVVMKMEA